MVGEKLVLTGVEGTFTFLWGVFAVVRGEVYG